MLKNFKRAAKKCNGGLLMKRIILAMFEMHTTTPISNF